MTQSANLAGLLNQSVVQLPIGTTAARPTSPTAGNVRYNSTLDTAEVYTGAGWGSFGSPLGTVGNPAVSGAALAADQPSAPAGLYWFKNSSGVSQQMYCDVPGGGWVLVASNNASDSLFPAGTGRYSTSYYINRNGTVGALGTASPNSDYLAGGWLDTFAFTQARCVAFGRNSTNGTYSWSNLGTYITAQYTLSTTGTSRYSEVVLRANVTFGGNGTPPVSSAAYFALDGILMDNINGGFTANSDQTTIGMVGVAGSNGDPSNGCYMGHGVSESSGSYEGWYDGSNVNQNAQGYTTWVK